MPTTFIEGVYEVEPASSEDGAEDGTENGAKETGSVPVRTSILACAPAKISWQRFWEF